jgi:hypothetical protein
MICGTTSPLTTKRIVVDVTGHIAPGNGVADPNPAVGIYSYKNGVVTGDVEGLDPDGYVHSITATWPDGTTHTYINTAPCRGQINGWPTSQMSFRWTKRMKPGLYTVKAVVTSTDCEGGSPQMLTDLRPFRVLKTSWENSGPNVYLPHAPQSTGEGDGSPINLKETRG